MRYHIAVCCAVLGIGMGCQTEGHRKEANLLDAAFCGDLSRVHAMLDQKVNANCQAPNGATPLMLACAGGSTQQFAIVECLLGRGASVNMQTAKGVTALRVAAFTGQKEIVQFLLATGADVQLGAPTGKTPVLDASGYSDFCIHGTIVDAIACTERGNPPSGGQFGFGRPREYRVHIIRMLLKAGADPKAKDEEGRTLLMHVVLSAGHDPELFDSELAQIVPEILATGIDINARDREGRTCLTYAKDMAARDNHWQPPGMGKIITLLVDHAAVE